MWLFGGNAPIPPTTEGGSRSFDTAQIQESETAQDLQELRVFGKE